MTNHPTRYKLRHLASGITLTFVHVVFPTLRTINAIIEGIPSSYRVYIWYRETRMVGLQYCEGRMMIGLVLWAQCINVTDTLTATSP